MRLIGEQGKKYRRVLIAGAVAAILTYFLMQVLGPRLAQYGLINSWASIQNPPSGTAKIIGITGGGWSMKYEVWVEARDGQRFSASICSEDQKCDPPVWKWMPGVSTATSRFFTDARGTDCKDLGEFPLNPSGQIVECVYAVDTSIDLVPQIYFALMADGSLRYFELGFYNYFRVLGKFILTSALLFFIMLLLVFQFTNFVTKRIQLKKEHVSGLATN